MQWLVDLVRSWGDDTIRPSKRRFFVMGDVKVHRCNDGYYVLDDAEMRRWLRANTVGTWRARAKPIWDKGHTHPTGVDPGIVFSDESDAVMFQLTWGGERSKL